MGRPELLPRPTAPPTAHFRSEDHQTSPDRFALSAGVPQPKPLYRGLLLPSWQTHHVAKTPEWCQLPYAMLEGEPVRNNLQATAIQCPAGGFGRRKNCQRCGRDRTKLWLSFRAGQTASLIKLSLANSSQVAFPVLRRTMPDVD